LGIGDWALVLSVRVASRREVVGAASRREVLGIGHWALGIGHWEDLNEDSDPNQILKIFFLKTGISKHQLL
jgi:hypothetical protein